MGAGEVDSMHAYVFTVAEINSAALVVDNELLGCMYRAGRKEGSNV